MDDFEQKRKEHHLGKLHNGRAHAAYMYTGSANTCFRTVFLNFSTYSVLSNLVIYGEDIISVLPN